MIPLLPLEVQQHIVAEITEKQNAIAACRRLVDSHEKKIHTKITDLWGDSSDA